MSEPSISQRLHYRSVPGDAEEPTSTIVLTSTKSYFVDIRILKDEKAQEKSEDNNGYSELEWAFAGQSHTKHLSGLKNESGSRSHTVWEHWVDSNSDHPPPDEGDMTVLANGDVLEEGSTIDPNTGVTKRYEELWKDLAVEPSNAQQKRRCLVLRTESSNRETLGMVILLGRWCQGLLKNGSNLTAERWHEVHDKGVGQDQQAPLHRQGTGQWSKIFSMGSTKLPCESLCKDDCALRLDAIVDCDEIRWRVVEDHSW